MMISYEPPEVTELYYDICKDSYMNKYVASGIVGQVARLLYSQGYRKPAKVMVFSDYDISG